MADYYEPKPKDRPGYFAEIVRQQEIDARPTLDVDQFERKVHAWRRQDHYVTRDGKPIRRHDPVAEALRRFERTAASVGTVVPGAGARTCSARQTASLATRLPIQRAAEELGVRLSQLYSWLHAGRLRWTGSADGEVMVSRAAVEELIREERAKVPARSV